MQVCAAAFETLQVAEYSRLKMAEAFAAGVHGPTSANTGRDVCTSMLVYTSSLGDLFGPNWYGLHRH